jgi:hypothetical protein
MPLRQQIEGELSYLIGEAAGDLGRVELLGAQQRIPLAAIGLTACPRQREPRGARPG